MKTAICTISSTSHLFKVETLFSSLKERTTADLHCLISEPTTQVINSPSYTCHPLDSLTSESAIQMKKKYKGNRLRWGLKPIFQLKLLNDGYDSVIYVDNDIFFYSSPDFLFEKLLSSSVLLTPHFYPSDSTRDQNWLEANYQVGLYNAGFIGVNKKATDMLVWWTQCCLYNLKKSFSRGLFDDQKYLDLVPVIFENVEILKHKGCNVAGWNITTSPRSVSTDNKIILDSIWDLVFIHYNYYTLQCILNGKDDLLSEPLKIYHSRLLTYFPKYQLKADITSHTRDFYQYFQYIRYRMARLFE